MTDTLSGQFLFEHANALAGVIGARPPASRAEMQARQYLCHALADQGIASTYLQEETFYVPDRVPHALATTSLLALASNFLPRNLRWLGGLLALYSAYSAYQASLNRRQAGFDLLSRLPKITQESANLIVKIPAKGWARHKVVLLANIDSPPERLTYGVNGKSSLRALHTISIVSALLNGVAQLGDNAGLRRLTATLLALTAPPVLIEAGANNTSGANDNASGCACLIGLAGALTHNPLENTEVWAVFVGAEHVSGAGLHKLLDQHRETLASATFIGLERVGAGQVVYCTHHTGLSYLGDYTPDHESLMLAMEVAHAHPELGVHGASLNTLDMIGGVRARGFKGISLTATDGAGWLPHWNQASDVMGVISPQNLERSARFCLAMLHGLDQKS